MLLQIFQDQFSDEIPRNDKKDIDANKSAGESKTRMTENDTENCNSSQTVDVGPVRSVSAPCCTCLWVSCATFIALLFHVHHMVYAV